MQRYAAVQNIEYRLVEEKPGLRPWISLQPFVLIYASSYDSEVPRLMTDYEIDERLRSLGKRLDDPVGAAAKIALKGAIARIRDR